MTLDSENLIESILDSLSRIQFIDAEDIPNIDLYMDQVTTFMDQHLKSTTRYPQEDKVLTKTMINNYAKNDLLPPPVKKKYSKEHVLFLIFIYYFKNVMSISDIQTLLTPVAERYFGKKLPFDLQKLYTEVVRLEESEIEHLKEDVRRSYQQSAGAIQDAPKEDAEFLQTFAFICLLSFDIYVKKLMVEKMIDELAAKEKAPSPPEKKPQNAKPKKNAAPKEH